MNDLKTNTSDFHLIIFTNSPGEISSWVIPFVSTFKSIYSQSFVTVMLTPCDYASGNEFDLLQSNALVDEVYSPKDTMTFVFFRKKFFVNSKKGAIVFLGGEPLYAQLFSFRVPYSLYGYTQRKQKLGLFYKKTFFKHIDGDLMSAGILNRQFEKVAIFKKYKLEKKPYCLFMPGSRPQHFKLFLPLIFSTIKLIREYDPSFEAIISLSSFITHSDFDMLNLNTNQKGIHIIRGDSLELMAISRLMVTIPGTNTAQAMYMRLPMLVALPLNNPEIFVVDGILQHIFKIPFIGSFIRKQLVSVYLKKNPYLSLPNIIANKPIVPEIVSLFNSTMFKDHILSLYHDDKTLNQIKLELEKIPFPDSVDKKISHAILEH